MLDSSKLDVADRGMMHMAQAGFGQRNGPQPGDEELMVRFISDIVEDREASQREGRPIFKEVPFVQIMTPGDREIFSVMADQGYKQRFPKQWEAYERMQDEDAIEGTPLSEWPGIKRAQAEELKFYNVHTLEQLANVPDHQIDNFQGFATIRERARRYLAASKDQAEANEKEALEKRLASLEEKLELASNTIAEQNVMIDTLKGAAQVTPASALRATLDEPEPKPKRRRKAAQE